MGHLNRLKSEYRDLVGRLDAGPVAFPEPEDPAAAQGWREILEILYTPEEAALAARLPVRPTSLEALSRRLGEAEEALQARLEPMCDKGLVMDLVHPRSGKRAYLLSPPVVGFFEYSLMRAKDSVPKKRMAEALHAYTHGDPAFAREAFAGETRLGRALVHETALSDEPLPDVLDWERASAVVEDARSLAVSLCYCRHKAQHLGQDCDAPAENCLSLNGGADFVTRRGFGRAIDKAEATDLLAAARARGLVQIADNVMARPTFVCNCCGCCCEQLQASNHWGLASVNPSGFVPRHAPERCSGCSRCARACPLGAIAMAPVRAAGKPRNGLAPRVDAERCIGCGVCAGACHKGALSMARDHRPRVPASSVEKAIRMALERNRLADLLFDAGAGLGSRFLHHALAALTRLPAAERVLASEQVRSRFVRAAMAGFGKRA
ncbi:MAG TPA: 4Fe-4S dicluster domain-containing protein [Anaeromyxobacteraceae bacterium]|jgi:ferredoxin|nr:4Fe-4S dicluster domain-containing protein [Anaeromyxobacteraceae bacterium]